MGWGQCQWGDPLESGHPKDRLREEGHGRGPRKLEMRTKGLGGVRKYRIRRVRKYRIRESVNTGSDQSSAWMRKALISIQHEFVFRLSPIERGFR